MLLDIIILVSVLLDQLTKLLIKISMSLYETIPIIDNVFSITYIHNTGAAFSIFQDKTILLIAIQSIVIIAMFAFIITKGKEIDKFLKVSIGLIIGGGFGNLIDRVFLGYVVDFFDFHFWPIFHVADISVCVGCGLLVIYVFLIEGKVKNEQ